MIYIILYYTILYYIVLYYIILYYIVCFSYGYDLLWRIEDDIWFKVESTIDGWLFGGKLTKGTEPIDFGVPISI